MKIQEVIGTGLACAGIYCIGKTVMAIPGVISYVVKTVKENKKDSSIITE